MRNDDQETAFLKRVILYGDTPEGLELEERITQAQRDEHCVRRAAWLMTLLIALAAAGLGYVAVFLPDFSRYTSSVLVQVFAVLGLGSSFCLIGFVGYWTFHRRELDKQRDQCRRLASRLLEDRLGKPVLGEFVPIVAERQRPAEPPCG